MAKILAGQLGYVDGNGFVKTPPKYKWYKPWTWRHGSRKGDVWVATYDLDMRNGGWDNGK